MKKRIQVLTNAAIRVLCALVITVGLAPLPTMPAYAVDDGESASADTSAVVDTSFESHALIAQAEADGTCASGEALVVYHASGAAKGSTGALSVQSASDPLAEAGFSVSKTWDVSAADDADSAVAADADGALSVQSEESGSALASGSDVRVALVERDDMSVADLVASLESLDFVECAGPNYAYELAEDDTASMSAATGTADSVVTGSGATGTSTASDSIADGTASAAASGSAQESTTASASPSASTDAEIASSANTSSAAASSSATSARALVTQSLEAQSIPLTAQALTKDTFSDMQWSFTSATAGIDEAAALSAESSGTTDNVVAVLDSGVDYENPDLANVMWTNTAGLAAGPADSHGYNSYADNYDPMPGSAARAATHGTHCAGLVAAQANNNEGIAGVAGTGHTKIMGLRATDDSGVGFSTAFSVGCYEYMIQAKLAGVNIVAVNNSWGATNGSNYDPVLDYLVNQAGKAGILSCFAAQNYSLDIGSEYSTVALESPYAIMVASSNEYNEFSSFSNYNATAVDVAAPGSKMLSTVSNGVSTSFFNALYSKENGKADKLSYYTDVASLVGDGASGLIVELADLGTEAQKALTVTTGSTLYGQPAVALNIDYDALAQLGSTPDQVAVRVKWTMENPFYDTTGLNASDYSLSVTAACTSYGVGEEVDVLPYILDSGNNSLVTSGTAYVDKWDTSGSAGGPLTSLATEDQTLTGGVLVICLNGLDQKASVGKKTILLSGFGIGKNTDPMQDSASAVTSYGRLDGTSMATPLLTGCVAELASLSAYKNCTPLQLRGIVCGGTEALATESDQAKLASGGRFTFAAALDNAKVNANTWSVTTSGTNVTVHGYNLDDATLSVDGTDVTPTARSSSEITFTADTSLFDGQRHRFDVTDGTTGRTYKAAYVMPDSASASLVRVHNLPVVSDAATGKLVSATDRLFFADAYGTYLYSCADPDDATSAWTELAAPGTPADAVGTSVFNRLLMSYTYANGKLYAFYNDGVVAADGTASCVVYANTYDIASGTWSGFTQLGSVTSYMAASLSATAVDGTVFCVLSYFPTQTAGNLAVYSCTPGSATFTEKICELPQALVSTPMSYAATQGTNYSLGVAGDASAYVMELTSFVADDTGYGYKDNGALSEYDATTDLFACQSLQSAALTGVGNGIVVAGFSRLGLGDVQLIDPSTATATEIGMFGLTSADGLAASAVAMYGGKLYFNCAKHTGTSARATAQASTTAQAATEEQATSAQAATDEQATSAQADGLAAQSAAEDVGLYTLPSAAAAKVTTTDVTSAAAAETGGAATVADWRGNAASTLGMREGDTATWTAVAEVGYAFAGWYDADGNLVSTDATYGAAATESRTLTARFTKNASPSQSTSTSTSTSRSTVIPSASTPAAAASRESQLPDTGDPFGSAAFGLALIVGLTIVASAGACHVLRRGASRHTSE